MSERAESERSTRTPVFFRFEARWQRGGLSSVRSAPGHAQIATVPQMVHRRVADSLVPRLLALLLLAAAAMPSLGLMSAAAAPPAAIPIGDADGDGDIDLDDLFKRLSDSKAVGVLTKISLKREIDELERDLKAFHGGTVKSTLDKLHERYDLLVHKLMSLLQSKDPGLARDIARARDLLWSKLADPSEFTRL